MGDELDVARIETVRIEIESGTWSTPQAGVGRGTLVVSDERPGVHQVDFTWGLNPSGSYEVVELRLIATEPLP
jgi:hypothetical protein